MKARISIKATAVKRLIISVTFSALLLIALPLMAADTVLATVNGLGITESQLEIAAIQSKINFKEITPEQKKLLTDALINRQLVLNQATEANYHKTPDIMARVKALTESYVAANYLSTIVKEIKITEIEMKAYYNKNVLNNSTKEFKARHILVKTEDEAKSLIKDLQADADFSKLAKEKSIDTGSGSRGGDLGWFKKQDMVAPFSSKVANLKKGEMAKTPVQSKFGWHVIILDDIRTIEPPEFNAVKQSIEKVLLKEKLNEYLKSLRTDADVVLK